MLLFPTAVDFSLQFLSSTSHGQLALSSASTLQRHANSRGDEHSSNKYDDWKRHSWVCHRVAVVILVSEHEGHVEMPSDEVVDGGCFRRSAKWQVDALAAEEFC